MTKRPNFKILREKVAEQDGLDTQTHQSIAQHLVDIIEQESEEGGLTIGLEGAYGSGKSTIVNLFRKEMNKLSEKYHVFYFDSWQHEGDPLRRSFLEGFLESIKSKDEEFVKLREKVSKRLVVKKVTTARTTSWLTILLLISAMFSSFGYWLLNRIDASTITVCWGCKVHQLGLFAALVATMPILALSFWGIKILVQKRSYKALLILDNWPLIQDGANVETSQETTQEEERTSVEFEKYFKQALGFIEGKQVILIVDNLDRVQPEVGLKIISTLQTFIQHRNTAEKDWSKYIWAIIPYDEKALSKLWASKAGNNIFDEQAVAYSVFLNKLFQIIIEVPNMVIDSWQKFLISCIEEAFSGWSPKDQILIIDLFKATRKDLLDIPEPRDIKNFINQVGLHRAQYENDVSLAAIVYYCIKRFVKKEDKLVFKKSLTEGGLFETNVAVILEREIKNNLVGQLAAIVFRVPIEDALIMLLQPEIRRGLIYGEFETLKRIQKVHGDNFYFICDHIYAKTTPKLIELDCLIRLGNNTRNKTYVLHFEQNISGNKYPLPEDEILLAAYQNVLPKVKNQVVEAIISQLQAQLQGNMVGDKVVISDNYNVLRSMNEIINSLDIECKIKPIEVSLSLLQALDIVTESQDQEIGLNKVFRFNNSLFEQFKKAIEIKEEQPFLIDYFYLVKEFKKQGFPVNQLFDILLRYKLNVSPPLKFPPNENFFLCLIFLAINSEGDLKRVFDLNHALFSKLRNIQWPNYSIKNVSLSEVGEGILIPENLVTHPKPYWSESRPDRIQLVIKLMELIEYNEFLWVLANNQQLKLAHSIILNNLEKNVNLLSLNSGDVLNKTNACFKLIKGLTNEEGRQVTMLNNILKVKEVKLLILKEENLAKLDKAIIRLLLKTSLTTNQKLRIQQLDKR